MLLSGQKCNFFDQRWVIFPFYCRIFATSCVLLLTCFAPNLFHFELDSPVIDLRLVASTSDTFWWQQVRIRTPNWALYATRRCFVAFFTYLSLTSISPYLSKFEHVLTALGLYLAS